MHEGPRHSGAGEWTAFSTWAVHLAALALAADKSSGTREAELVMRYGRTLDEMSVLQALSAEGATQQGLRAARRLAGGGAAATAARTHLTQGRLRDRGGGGGWTAAGGASSGGVGCGHAGALPGHLGGAQAVRHSHEGGNGRGLAV